MGRRAQIRLAIWRAFVYVARRKRRRQVGQKFIGGLIGKQRWTTGAGSNSSLYGGPGFVESHTKVLRWAGATQLPGVASSLVKTTHTWSDIALSADRGFRDLHEHLEEMEERLELLEVRQLEAAERPKTGLRALCG